MNQATNTENIIYTYAFLGVLLFIAAIGFTLANIPAIIAFNLSATAIVSVLGLSAISLLYTAMKLDKGRLRDHAYIGIIEIPAILVFI